MEAADILTNFTKYWDGCENVAQPAEAWKQLLAKMVDRVFVHEDRVAIALYQDFGIVLGNEYPAFAEMLEQVRDGEKTRAQVILTLPPVPSAGATGFRLLSGQRIFVWALRSEPHHIFIRLLLRFMCSVAT